MKLGTEVGLGHGHIHIVLDGDPAPPNFRPMSVVASDVKFREIFSRWKIQ